MLKTEKRIKLDYLVTGTGRCGSVYMARLLTSLGINCTHEAIFTHLGIDHAKKVIERRKPIQNSYCSMNNQIDGSPIENWVDVSKVKAESSYMAAPYLNDSLFDNVKIIHVVRNPLKVISSHVLDIKFFEFDIVHVENMNLWQDFVLEHLSQLEEIENPIERACYYYIEWNEMIESNARNKPYLLHKVEDGCTDALIEFLNCDKSSNYFDEKTTNSWKKRTKDLTLDDIPDGSIKKGFIETASRYEYI